jgi:glycosyltransferase involved in cell wall biosynthesis
MDLANALQQGGNEVTVITSRHPGKLSGETLGSGVTVRYLAQGSPGDYSREFFSGVERECAMLDAVAPFDIVHVQEFAGLFMQPRPGRLVCSVHGEKLRAAWRHKARIALHPFFVRMIRRADRLLVDSEFTGREVRRIDPALAPKIRRVCLGLEPSRYSPPDKAAAAATGFNPFTIALLGRTQEMKGIPEALAAAYRLRSRGIPFRMKIGGPPDSSGWFDSAMRLGWLYECVRLCGTIPPEKLSAFLSDADVFLFPDRTQPAFGLVSLEAMLHGLPVVAARSGAIPEVVNDEVGWFFTPWSAQELTALLERLSRNPAEVHKKGAMARLHAASYTAEAMARETVNAYRELSGS